MGEETSSQLRAWNREMTNIDKHPRDLLKGFISENGCVGRGRETTDYEDESTVELNLGLSLGGQFGVDKTQRKLKRSSSVLGFEISTEVEPENYTVGLVRTTSLPAEMEEEWRKRKEMQSLRRMEAKRRRCEKQSQTFETDSKNVYLQRHLVSCHKQMSGGSSSSLSEMDNKNQQGSSNSCGDVISPKTMTSSEKPSMNDDEKGVRREEESVDRKGKGMVANGLFDMPCVFTKGDGPNGRRVDGILYKYGKGDEVRIMCICHGSFLTPAEFVKHGGGGDVDRPLRHIVVNTSASMF